MLRNRSLWAAAVSSLGVAAFAHNGATGVVMDRMMGMTAMRDVMASLAPMMQGETEYNVRTVQESAAMIIAHSGDNMNRLFPEGSLQTASYAKPEIWEDWEDFAALSEQLKAYALGMGIAAPNGLRAPASSAAASGDGAMDHSMMQMDASAGAPAPSSDGAMDHSMMQMDSSPASGTTSTPAASPDATYSVAELMAVDRPELATRSATEASLKETVDFTLMAADDAFEMVSQVCSACHAQFRSGS